MTLFQEQRKLPFARPISLEPSLNITDYHNWSQCLRILTEIQILKQALHFKTLTPTLSIVKNKRSVDVFNKLNQVSALWSVLIGGQINIASIYAEAMRLNEDVSFLLQAQKMTDTAVPPRKQLNATLGDALETGFDILAQLQNLQTYHGVETFNLEEFHIAKQTVQSQEVFNLIELLIIELQPIKVKLGLKHTITPIVQYYETKKVADVVQLLGYVTQKLKLLNMSRERD
jgi:hypothetical protein